MKDVICVKITKSHIYDCATKRIGRKGENLSTCFEITLDNDLVNLDVFMEFLKPNGESLATPKLELINNVATYDVPLYLLDTAGELKAQIVLRNTETGKVWKTYIKKYLIEDGICACDDIPNKEDWITHAENLLNQIENGLTPTIGDNENWFILDKDTGKPSRGPKGDAYIITEEDYEEIETQVKEDIQPQLDEMKDIAETAESIAKGANQCKTYGDYPTFIEAFNLIPKDKYSVGQDVRIVQVEVPDIWVAYIEEQSVEYVYTTDEAFVNELITNGTVQVGYYKFGMLETQKVNLKDYVKNTDIASNNATGNLGLVRGSGNGGGITINSAGSLYITRASEAAIDARKSNYNPIVPANLDYAVGTVKASETQSGTAKIWASTNEDSEIGLNISTEV